VQPVAEPVVQLIPDGLLVTVPVPVPDMATVRESLVEPEVDDGGTRPWQPASRVVSANSDTQPTEACLKRYASESGESLMDPAASWLDNFSQIEKRKPRLFAMQATTVHEIDAGQAPYGCRACNLLRVDRTKGQALQTIFPTPKVKLARHFQLADPNGRERQPHGAADRSKSGSCWPRLLFPGSQHYWFRRSDKPEQHRYANVDKRQHRECITKRPVHNVP